jgi:hypothetical protein
MDDSQATPNFEVEDEEPMSTVILGIKGYVKIDINLTHMNRSSSPVGSEHSVDSKRSSVASVKSGRGRKPRGRKSSNVSVTSFKSKRSNVSVLSHKS